MAGWMSLTGEPGEPGEPGGSRSRPACRSGVSRPGCSPRTACWLLCSSVSAAARDRSVVDIAMLVSLVEMLAYQATGYFAAGAAPRREVNLHATIAPYGTFATADARRREIGPPGPVDRQRSPRPAGAGLRPRRADPLARPGSSRTTTCSSGGLQLRIRHEQLGEVSVPGEPWRINGEAVAARLALRCWASTPRRTCASSGSRRTAAEPPAPAKTRLTSLTQP